MSYNPGRVWIGPSLATSKKSIREELAATTGQVKIEVLDPQDSRSTILVEDLAPGENYRFANPGPTGSLNGFIGRTREGRIYVR